jgi:hypothetical protein
VRGSGASSPHLPEEGQAKRRLLVALGALGALLLAIAAYLFPPLGEPDLRAQPRPAGSYAEAVSRIEAVRRDDALAAGREKRRAPPFGSARLFAMAGGAPQRTRTAIVRETDAARVVSPMKRTRNEYVPRARGT